MAEQTFRSPGFFEQEIDLSARVAAPLGVPAGVVGTAARGPAFVPVTVGSLADFTAKFGGMDQDRFGPYAVREFLKNRNAVTYVRTLGAGVIENDTDINNAELGGFAKNAGTKLESTRRLAGGGAAAKAQGLHGAVTFITAIHRTREDGSGSEALGFPVFSDNDSFNLGSNQAHLVRAVILLDKDSRIIPAVTSDGVTPGTPATQTNLALTNSRKVNADKATGRFTLWVAQDGQEGSRVEQVSDTTGKAYVVSLDPNDQMYITNVMNTDPDQFADLKHLVYLDYAVEDEVASLKRDTAADPAVDAAVVGVYTGAPALNQGTGYDPALLSSEAFGRLDSRFQTARTPHIISQPFGDSEYDLFYFEAIDDGAIGNELYKVSIANLRRSSDPNNPYGTFDVQVRSFGDTDTNLEVLEAYPACDLNPASENYIAKKIGDKKVFYNFNASDIEDRGLAITGKSPNKSSRIRVRMHSDVENKEIPPETLPFGFRGVPALKTSRTLQDHATATSPFVGIGSNQGLADNPGVLQGSILLPDSGVADSGGSATDLQFSIVPPLPFRFKCTRGAVTSDGSPYVGKPGENERSDARLYWGVKFERMPVSSSADQGSVTDAVMNPNVGGLPNRLISSYARFQGISQLGTMVTGSGADLFNNNKFTLARVALANHADKSGVGQELNEVTGTAKDHMRDAAYIRNGVPDSTYYTISDTNMHGDDTDGKQQRLTFASMVNNKSATVFNRFAEYAKFTTMFYGGYDGVNFLDRDNRLMNDKASSSDTGGKATDSTPAIGLKSHVAGKGSKNNVVSSFKEAVSIITNPMASRINILAVPGMRDAFISDHALEAVKSYSMAIYLMDIIKYGTGGTRLFDGDSTKVDVQETAEQFEGRVIDNNYGAAYFPDVDLLDTTSNEVVSVPASVAAIGAIGFNDRVAYPWFAPAGFNRGALESVTNVDVRLNSADRDLLYDARINPIAVFPTGGFVIFGQKTLQVAKSALDRVNVRRLLLEVKRLVSGVATKLLFEQNNDQTRQRFVNQVTPLLTLIQAQAGIEKFGVVCDDTNNTEADRESNKMNGRIILVPTRAVEFIAIDFIVTNSGVSFE